MDESGVSLNAVSKIFGELVDLGIIIPDTTVIKKGYRYQRIYEVFVGNAMYLKPEYETIVKDPYILEFLNIPENEHFYESNLEQALINQLQKFLLELGRGFSFVARQKHINFDGRHTKYFVSIMVRIYS